MVINNLNFINIYTLILWKIPLLDLGNLKLWKVTKTLYWSRLSLKKVQVGLINTAIENFDWSKPFTGYNIHNQFSFFSAKKLQIFRRFISNKVILYDSQKPPWVNDEIWLLIKQNKLLFYTQRRDKRSKVWANSLTSLNLAFYKWIRRQTKWPLKLIDPF